MGVILPAKLIDPVQFVKLCWPSITLYDKQREVLYSLRDNDETIVPAANCMGKDFVTGLAVLWFFISRHPCRVVTTSVDDTQLNAVLWGEIRRFIQTSEIGLSSVDGGPLVVNDQKIRKIVKGSICGLSYILGRVASDDGSGFLGHHIADVGDGVPRTLFAADEASAVPDMYFDKALTWARRLLVIGNPYECENYFKRSVRKGTEYSADGNRCYRKVIQIKATHSPNVKYALAEKRRGLQPSYKMLIEGVKSYAEYEKNLATWDEAKQLISLEAEFYEGANVKMYPLEWLLSSQELARNLKGKPRRCVAIGCDPAEGGDDTVWTGVDKLGIVFQRAEKTPDTSTITGVSLALMKECKVEPEQVLFDSGGGGKQHADRLRSMGHNVRTIAFGEAAVDPLTQLNLARGYRPGAQKIDERETKYIYKNRRAEMYHQLRLLIENGWGIPEEYEELIRQLKPIPLLYDGEGRIYMLPKNKKPGSKEQTLIDIIGNSPDEADSTVLAVYGMNNPRTQFVARAL